MSEPLRIEDLLPEAPHLVRLLERGRADLPIGLQAAAWVGARHDLERLKRQWQRDALEGARASIAQDGGT